ncbi:MAG: hypothetical protein V4726_09050 [Verrucomicrobiota bacterium]
MSENESVNDGNKDPAPEAGTGAETGTGKKKREGWLGTVVTGVICLGFLYFWFKPRKPDWEHQTTAQYVARAMAEPEAADVTARLVLDFDLMETAILQARQGMAPEGAETALRIGDPLVQARAIRQLAWAHLNNDPKRMGDALTMCDRIADPAARTRMRQEILLQIAGMGFPDAALPEAGTLLLRARLARRLAETDGQAMARDILKEIDTALPSLPAEEAAPLRLETAWIHVGLTLSDGAKQAFPAIKNLPPAEQGELWLDLFRICFGLGDTAAGEAAAVAAQVTDPVLKRRMELEALDSNMPLRPAEEILAELRAELKAAAPGVPHIHALVALAAAQSRTVQGDPEAAANTLRMAYDSALALTDPIQRATLLSELSEALPDALLLAENTQALTAAASAARTVITPDERLPVLILVLRQAFNAGELKLAADLASEANAVAVSPGSTLKPEPLADLADFLVRIGDWSAGLNLLSKTADAPARALLLDELATITAEDTIGYNASQPPNRGEPLDRIRNRAISDETGAAIWAQEQTAGPLRARAWLAIAKGQLLSPGALPMATPDGSLPPGSDISMDGPGPSPDGTGPDSGAGGVIPSGDSDPLLTPQAGAPNSPVNQDPAPPVIPPGDSEPPLPEK